MLNIFKEIFKCFSTSIQWSRDVFNSPKKVLIACAIFLLTAIVLDGSLLRLWGLHRSNADMQSRINNLESSVTKLEKLLDRSQQPEFVEMKVRNQFDLVNKEEMLFVFSE